MKKRKIFTNFQIVLVSTAIYMLFTIFLSDENYFYREKLKERRQLQVIEIDSLQRQITNDSTELYLLQNDDEYLEKFARENFYMYRTGEDIFVAE